MDRQIPGNLNRLLDHSALHPEVDEKAIQILCQEAIRYDFHAIAVNPAWTRLAAGLLPGTRVKLLSVAGFPIGANRNDIKVTEATKGVSDGAHEIDMVANIGWLVSGEYRKVEAEINEVRQALPYNVLLKVIIEAGKLSQQQQIEATRAVINGGAQFVKTCTGFFGGATAEQVRTLHGASEGQIEVKASGGIRAAQQCYQLLEAGAARLGSSSSVSIMQEIVSSGPR